MKTKVVAKLLRRSTNEDGSMEITFQVDNYRYRNYLNNLEKKDYSVVIDDVNKPRTLQQNGYLWALIHEISQNENAQSDDDYDIYCYLLAEAKAKYVNLMARKDTLNLLKEKFRDVQVLSYVINEDGLEYANCRCFIGSSQLNTKEMGVLIDKALEYACNLGIDTTYYEEVLR